MRHPRATAALLLLGLAVVTAVAVHSDHGLTSAEADANAHSVRAKAVAKAHGRVSSVKRLSQVLKRAASHAAVKPGRTMCGCLVDNAGVLLAGPGGPGALPNQCAACSVIPHGATPVPVGIVPLDFCTQVVVPLIAYRQQRTTARNNAWTRDRICNNDGGKRTFRFFEVPDAFNTLVPRVGFEFESTRTRFVNDNWSKQKLGLALGVDACAYGTALARTSWKNPAKLTMSMLKMECDEHPLKVETIISPIPNNPTATRAARVAAQYLDNAMVELTAAAATPTFNAVRQRFNALLDACPAADRAARLFRADDLQANAVLAAQTLTVNAGPAVPQLAAFATQVSYDLTLEGLANTVAGATNFVSLLKPAVMHPAVKQAPYVWNAARLAAQDVVGALGVAAYAADCELRGVVTLFFMTMTGNIASAGVTAGVARGDADAKNWYGAMPKAQIHESFNRIATAAKKAALNAWAGVAGNALVAANFMIARLQAPVATGNAAVDHPGLLHAGGGLQFNEWLRNPAYPAGAAVRADTVANWITVFRAEVAAHMNLLTTGAVAHDDGPRGAPPAGIASFARNNHIWVVMESREDDALNQAMRPFSPDATAAAMSATLLAVQTNYVC